MKKPLALQLHSVRQLVENSFPQVLKQIAKIGYQGVEFAGLYDYDSKDIAELLNELELKAVGSHYPIPNQSNIKQICNESSILGCKIIITSSRQDDMKTKTQLQSYIDKLKNAVQLTESNGLTLAMHNHWWEFDRVFDNETPFEIITHQIPELQIELDIYWAAKAGTKPLEVLNTWQDRIKMIHVKDGDLSDRLVHTAVGKGKLNISKILSSADPSAIDWLIVELDNCDTDIMQAIEDSYNWLMQNGFATDTKQ